MESSNEIDLDDLEGIGKIQSVICVDKFFYILSNNKMESQVFFNENPQKKSLCINKNEKSYLLSWKNRLEISDTN